MLSYLVFALLYFPCLATTSVLSKEIGKKWTFIGIIIEFFVAYFVAMMVYNLARAIEVFGFAKVAVALTIAIIVICAIVFVVKFTKKGKGCPYKDKCNKNCKKCG